MTRAELVDEIHRRLGRRRLVWFGTRGDDAEALCDIEHFAAAYSFIGTLRSRPSVPGLSLEDIDGRRPDLDTYDIDSELRADAVETLRDAILTELSRPSAVVPYRPSTFLSAICFARHDRCLHLGMFKGHQDAFEHKPWVETGVAALGLNTIPWQYVPDIEMLNTRTLLDNGPVMLRRSRTSGGVGLEFVDDPSALESLWPTEDEAYVSVAPFIDDALPLNIGAVVWKDGVTVHPASVQLIGIPGCTTRRFGYCGNDFAAAADIDATVLTKVEQATRLVGRWMQGFGYRGAFGVDFLVKDGEPLFTEVNPRFQGSTHLSCRIAVERDESCLLIEHIAAHLGASAPNSMPLARQMSDGVRMSHLVVHNPSAEPQSIEPEPMVSAFRELVGFRRADVLTRPALTTAPDATVARVTLDGSITTTGYSLHASLAAELVPFFGFRSAQPGLHAAATVDGGAKRCG